MRAFTIRASDIARCPKHSLLASHYRDDGTCKCVEPKKNCKRDQLEDSND